MAADIVLVSRYPLDTQGVEALRTVLRDREDIRYLVDFSHQELLQLRAYENLAAFAASRQALESDWERFAPHMTGDVRRELLQYIEAPKPTETLLPDEDYLQLRHVEVLPRQMSAYRVWRQETIFEVVRASPPVETFLAYHSLVSGQPGVMFISGFSGPLKPYQEVFESTRYKEIVHQAAANYITGGTEGLFTRLYVRPSLMVA